MEKSAEMLIGTPVEIPVVPGNSERNTGKISGETLAANPKKKPPYGSLAETPEEQNSYKPPVKNKTFDKIKQELREKSREEFYYKLRKYLKKELR